jgi:hypothetical protein
LDGTGKKLASLLIQVSWPWSYDTTLMPTFGGSFYGVAHSAVFHQGIPRPPQASANSDFTAVGNASVPVYGMYIN